jgi:hypothetical protein
MDQAAADMVAALILHPEPGEGSDVRIFVRNRPHEDEMGHKKKLTWAKAQVSDGSGGSVWFQDIVDTCLGT